jgi:hypothetical protein
MQTWTVAAVLGAVALVWAGASAQDVRTTPGLGTGIVKVEGTVAVGNVPEVRATQNGEWRLAVSNTPTVRVGNNVTVASPAFLREGGRYRITWIAGEAEVVTVADPGTNGWIRVESGSGRRWVNTSVVRGIEEVR